jgi:hypothetical protein
MKSRLRGTLVIIVVLIVGAYLGSALSEWSGPTAVETAEAGQPPLGRVRVEVLNGGGISGLARSAVDELRERGFDVVYYGNQEPFDADSSVVLDRVGDARMAEAVAEALGIARVRSEPDANLLLDVSVVLGQEWEPAVRAAPLEEEPAWWDVRRLFQGGNADVGSGDEGAAGRQERMADPGEPEDQGS